MRSLMRMMASAGSKVIDVTTTITVGTIYSDKYITEIGYSDAANIGSLGSQTFYKGTNCALVETFNAGTLIVTFDGIFTQDWFTTLYVEINSIVTAFTSASASFSTGGGQSTWQWTVGNVVTSGNLRIVGQ